MVKVTIDTGKGYTHLISALGRARSNHGWCVDWNEGAQGHWVITCPVEYYNRFDLVMAQPELYDTPTRHKAAAWYKKHGLI